MIGDVRIGCCFLAEFEEALDRFGTFREGFEDDDDDHNHDGAEAEAGKYGPDRSSQAKSCVSAES